VFKAVFKNPTNIADEAELRDVFGTDRLHLDVDTSVVFSGAVTVGVDISFAGQCALLGDVIIGNGSILTNVQLGSDNRIRPYSILTDVKAGDRNLFGPFCFIRDGCRVGDDCILGAHVEAARSTFGSGVRVSHRAFIGDARVGDRTIVGAGVVFCNYDGAGPQITEVGARVTLGSGTLLVPPLSVGDAALVGAGSTVTKDVPPGARIIQRR